MKNTFTFPHDFGARNDPALQNIVFEYGPAAGFAYWVLIEMLYEQGGRLPKNSYKQIAYAAHVPVEMIQGIVEGGTLFKSDRKYFWSDRVVFTLETKEEKSSKSRTAAQAKWAKWKKDKELECSADAQYMRPHSESKASAMPNNSNSNSNNNSKEVESKDSCSQENLFGEKETESKPKDMTPEEMVAIWNAGRGELSEVCKALSESQKQKARLRIKEFGKTKDEQVDTMKEITARLAKSDFANARTGGTWKADFWWLLKNSEHWVYVLNGRYDNRKPSDIRDIKNVNSLWKE